ncbi:DUF805 domain-containing protein [Sporolactobacillus sp. THM7-4]|nr:DUF805 domain-containing protein [Sporolactobacillus sp. THM7-4]
MHWYLDVIKNYTGFRGRATRTEFWMFTLINAIISIIAMLIDYYLLNGLRIVDTLYSLAVLLPSLAVQVRRLHDIGRTGWWILIGVIPVLGWIVLLIYNCTDSQDKENKYGPNPKEGM